MEMEITSAARISQFSVAPNNVAASRIEDLGTPSGDTENYRNGSPPLSQDGDGAPARGGGQLENGHYHRCKGDNDCQSINNILHA